MRSSVGVVGLDLEINTKQFSRALKGLAGVFTGALVADSMLGFVKESMSLGSSLQELQNITTVVFGDMTKSVDDFCKSALDSFGLSELSAKRFTATIGAMFKTAGVTGEKLKIMSESVAALSGDFASFYDIDADEAFYKLMAGMSGEVEPLRRLAGIDLRQANLQDWLESTKGIKTSFEALDTHSQMLVRYNYLLSVTSAQQGDFARTSMSWANQTRILGEQFRNFQIIMGQGFINILTPVIQWLNAIIQKLIVAAQYFKAFTELIWGSAQINSDASDNAVWMADSMDKVGDSAKKASKKVKNSLAPFDQLNLLIQSTANASKEAADAAVDQIGELGGSVDLSKMTPPPMPIVIDIEALKAMQRSILDVLKAMQRSILDVLGPPLQVAISEILPVLSGWKDALFSTFSDVAKLGEPLKAWILNDLVPFIQQFIQHLGHIFSGLLDSALLVFNGIKEAAMPILSWFVTDGLPLMTDFGLGVMRVFTEIFDTAKFVFDMIYSGVIQPTLMLISKITVDTLEIIKGFWDKFGADIVGGLVTVFENIKMRFSMLWTHSLEPIWTNLLNMLTWLWDKHLKGLVEEFTNFVGKLVTGVLEIYNKVIAPIDKYLIEILGPSFSSAFNFIVDVLGSAIGAISDIIKGLLRSLGGIIDFIVGIFTGNWEKAWQGVKDIFGGVFDSVVGILKGAINLIIDALNFFIRAANKISFDIPDWVPELGGKKFGISIPQIPKLANGGLVSAPTLAMVGDNKNARVDPEVIAPLSKLQGMLDSGNGEVVALLRLILEALRSGDREAILKVEESTFGRVAIRAINTVQRQAGVTLLNV